jgi:hypothetical protein
VDGRDPNVASMDSTAARFFEVDVNGECGEETRVDACVGGAIAGPECCIEGDGGTITIGLGAADNDDCDGSSGFLRDKEAAIR